MSSIMIISGSFAEKEKLQAFSRQTATQYHDGAHLGKTTCEDKAYFVFSPP